MMAGIRHLIEPATLLEAIALAAFVAMLGVYAALFGGA